MKSRVAAELAWQQWIQDLGRQMRRTREFLGLTQQELSQRAGVSQGAVSRFEGGRTLSTPFLAIVRINVTLAQALGALDASTLSEDARRYLHHMDFLATPVDFLATPAETREPTGRQSQRARLRPTPRAKRGCASTGRWRPSGERVS